MIEPALLSLALAAGLVAALNPCGFALLPAYLALVAADGDGTGAADRAGRLARALRMSAGMTVGFVAVFGAFGAVAVPLALAFERWLPWVTVVVGAGLVLLGLWLLAGRELRLLAPRAGRAPLGGAWSSVGYGVAYALASLSCTVGPFLAVTTAAVTTGGPLGAGLTFVVYAVGMGLVVTGLAVAVATAREGLVRAMRRATGTVARVSGGLLVLAGAYVVWFGVYEVRVLGGGSTDDTVVGGALAVQGRLTSALAAVGPWPFVVAVVVAVLAVVLVRLRARERAASETVGR